MNNTSVTSPIFPGGFCVKRLVKARAVIEYRLTSADEMFRKTGQSRNNDTPYAKSFPQHFVEKNA